MSTWRHPHNSIANPHLPSRFRSFHPPSPVSYASVDPPIPENGQENHGPADANSPPRMEPKLRFSKRAESRTPILETIDDDTRTDGNVIIKVAGIRIPICMIKVEAGEWGCDPSIQAALTLRHFGYPEERGFGFFPIRGKTCCSTILLAGSGIWLAVLGAVFTDRPIVQRLTDMLWMGNSTTQPIECSMKRHIRPLFFIMDPFRPLIRPQYSHVTKALTCDAFSLVSMAVMEYIKLGAWSSSREDAKKQLKDVLGHLHGNGYVFDDLRKPNGDST